MELLQWRATNGITDKGFNEILRLIMKFLLDGNKFPASTYEAKEFVCPIVLEVQKMHACRNYCILYRVEEKKKLEVYLVCKASRYKIRCDDPYDVGGGPLGKEYLLKSFGTSL
jgi:hypothetical protein